MLNQTSYVNTLPIHAAPRFVISENVARIVSMSSIEIAELVGSRHDKVKQSIERLAARGAIQLPPLGEVRNHLGQAVEQYQVCKRDSFVVVAQLSPEFTAALVDRWQELEQGQGAKLPTTFAEALRLAAEQAELIEAQGHALAIAAPKVEFVDNYVDSTGLKGFRQTAKLLGANEARFREFLLDKKIMYRMGGEWQAYSGHIDAGRFDVKTGTSDSGHAFNQTKFTPKGVTWVAGLWAQYKLEAQ